MSHRDRLRATLKKNTSIAQSVENTKRQIPLPLQFKVEDQPVLIIPIPLYKLGTLLDICDRNFGLINQKLKLKLKLKKSNSHFFKISFQVICL